MRTLLHGRPQRIAVFAAVVLIPSAALLVANAVRPFLQRLVLVGVRYLAVVL